MTDTNLFRRKATECRRLAAAVRRGSIGCKVSTFNRAASLFDRPPLGHRERLPPHSRVSPRRVLQARPTLSARRATSIPAQLVRPCVGAPPDHERHKRYCYAVTAG